MSDDEYSICWPFIGKVSKEFTVLHDGKSAGQNHK